jgi:hypothetical protein
VGEFDWLDSAETVGKSDNFAWLDDDYSTESPLALDNPLIHARKVQRRQTVIAEKEQNLARIVTVLPPPDTELYIIGSAEGREHSRTGHILSNAFDFGSFVGHCIDLLLAETGAAGGVTLYVSTWVLNRDTVQMFRDYLNDGRLSSLHVLADKFLKRRHTAAVYAQLAEVIQAHPGSRIMLNPNHCKILCLSVGRRYVSITGSANLSAVARTEQYNLNTDPTTYFFYVDQFFEPLLTRKARG